MLKQGIQYYKQQGLSMKLSLFFLLIWVSSAFLAPFIAQEGSLIPYSPNTIDLLNANSVGPFDKQDVTALSYTHWLGTDEIGRDVLSNLLHGSRTALFIGFGAILLATLIGILLGSCAAIFGDDRLKASKFGMTFYSLFFGIILLFFIHLPWEYLDLFYLGTWLVVCLLVLFLGVFLIQQGIKRRKQKSINIPLDLIIGRMIETLDSLPLLFVLIILASIFDTGIVSTIIIIGLTGWAGIARFCRSELLKVKQLGYVESGIALGYTKSRILLKHMLPNVMTPIIITISFGISAAILIESTLSFIGLGVTTDTASWGKLLAEARSNYRAWWLAIFPGLAIFFTVLSCNTIGEKLSKKS